jgi:predicted ferric reductase
MSDFAVRADRLRAGFYTSHSGENTRRRAAYMATWAVFVVNGVFIVVLWYRGGNVSAVNSPGQLLSSIGRITGLLGAYLLLVQVLLLARLHWIERMVGFDHLTVWHRVNGKLCLYLVLAHVVFITIGYTLTDRITLRAEIGALLGMYPGMVTATVGTCLMVLVVASSLVIIRHRLRYELWYLVHLAAYASVLLTWFHELPTGNEFVTNPAASSYWTALYLITIALIILFRFIQPTFRAMWHRMRVIDITAEDSDVVSVRISGSQLARLHARPGQFFLWRFLTRDRWWESHPFSLSAAPKENELRITVKSSGDFSSRLKTLKPGTAIVAEGPFGVFTEAARRCENAVLIAGGIGITPVRALAEVLEGNVIVIYRVVHESGIIFRDELDRLVQKRGITVHYVTGDHSAPGGEHLMSPEHLTRLVPDIRSRDVFVCGPPGMANLIQRNTLHAGVPPAQIHMERFAL